MNFVIARTRPEVGRLLTSADGIKFCKIISHGVKTAYFCGGNGIIFSLCNQTFLKQTCTASWSKYVRVYTLSTGTRPQHIKHFSIYCHVKQLHFRFEVFFTT